MDKTIEANENNHKEVKCESSETKCDRDFDGMCNLCESDFGFSKAVVQHHKRLMSRLKKEDSLLEMWKIFPFNGRHEKAHEQEDML
jgi:hypothetical protein